MAGFGEKQRAIGEAALTQVKHKTNLNEELTNRLQFQRNIQNTVTNVKRLLGHKWNEKDFQDEVQHIHYKTFERADHTVGIEVHAAKYFRPYFLHCCS